MASLGDLVVPLGTEVAAVGDHLVVRHGPSRRSAVLNAPAAWVYLSLDGRRRVDAVADELAAETGRSRASVEPEVRAVVDELWRVGVVRLAAPGGGPVALAAPPTPRRAAPGSDRRWRPVVERLLAGRGWSLDRAGVPLIDTTCAVRVDDAEVAGLVDAVLAAPPVAGGPMVGPGPSPTDAHAIDVVTGRPAGRRRYRILVDGRMAGRVARPELAAEDVLHHLDALAIHHTPGRLLWHAGAVERAGRVVAVLGASGRGKSTLVASLVGRGAGYLTDEVVAVAPGSMEVEPYVKTLDLDGDAQHRLGLRAAGVVLAGPKHRFPVARLGRAGRGGTLALLVVLGGAEAPGSGVERLGPVDALVDLVGATFDATFDTPGKLGATAEVCEQVPAVRLGRLPLSHMAELVERLLADPGELATLSR